MDRPGVTSLREDIKSGKIDILIARDPDRLSRKLAHQLLLSEEFEKAGIKLEFLDFSWQDTPEGRLFYSIRGAIAEFEREKIRCRMVRGKTQKAIQGGLPMGFYAYGYFQPQGSGKIEIKKDEAEVVKKIFSLFISKDMGINGIAKWLNEAEIPTKKGKTKWHRQVVRQILCNPVYKGEWNYKGIIIPVPPIIDNETWEKSRKKMKKARRLWAGNSQNKYLLSGIISCDDCENTMNGIYTNWWGKKIRRYTCRKNNQGAKSTGCRPQKAIPAEAVENAVWEYVCSWLQSPEAIAEEITKISSTGNSTQQELKQVKKKLEDVEKGREKIIEAISSGFVELDDKIKEKLTELKKRKEKLEQQETELSKTLRIIDNITSRETELQRNTEELLSQLDRFDFSEKRALIRTLISRVIISEEERHHNVNVTLIAKLPGTNATSDYR